MPLVPVFDPTTGASGGAAAGGSGSSGIDVLPLEYIAINPATMTKFAPDVMDYTPAFDAGTGISTITMDALSPGNAKYSMTGSGAEWPRSHSPLLDSAGAAITSADSFVMMVRFSLYDTTVPSSADLRFGVGLCIDPTATTAGAFDGYGVTARTVSGSRKGGIVKLDSGSGSLSTYTQSGNTIIYGQIVRSARKLPVLLAYGETSGQMPANSYVDFTSTVELAADTAWQLWFGVSTATTSGTIAAGQSFAVKAEYQIIKLR
mgnify:CR=1 FL=1